MIAEAQKAASPRVLGTDSLIINLRLNIINYLLIKSYLFNCPFTNVAIFDGVLSLA